jgi:hypothetical protein
LPAGGWAADGWVVVLDDELLVLDAASASAEPPSASAPSAAMLPTVFVTVFKRTSLVVVGLHRDPTG